VESFELSRSERLSQRRIVHDVRSRSQEDQPGAEGAMGEGEAEEHDLSGRAEENRGGAESTVGEVEARSLRVCNTPVSS